MISNAELQYVNNYARFTPYPGDDYAYSVLNNLIEAYNLYLEKYNKKKYSLILSNGEEFQFSILNKNLCHLLGVDYKNIISEPMAKVREEVLGMDPTQTTNSFEILYRIIERANEVIQNDRTYGNYKILNYYKIMIKSAIFSKLSGFDEFNFGCINFNKQIFQNTIQDNFSPESTKFILMQSDESLIPYFMMGLKLDNGSNTYVPETLFAPTEFYNFFQNQELVLPIQMLIDDDQILTKIVASPQEKLNLLKLYRSIIETYHTNSFINIYNDYETVLRDAAVKNKVKQK